MSEKKTTLLEINIEEFSPSAGGLERMFGGNETVDADTGSTAGSKLGLFGSSDEETSDARDEDATEVAVEDEDEGEEADGDDESGGIGLVIGLLFLLIVAVLVKKFAVDSEPEEYEEVELSEYEN